MKTYSSAHLPFHLFYEIIEQLKTAVVITDETLNILHANNAFKRVVNYNNKNNFVDSFWLTIKQVLGFKWKVLCQENGKFIEQEIFFEFNYHPRWFICSGFWFCNAETNYKKYFLLLAREITSNKRQQEELHKNALRASLAEEELIDEMREILSGIIHQLQLPINVISAALAMVERRSENSIQKPFANTLQSILADLNHTIEHLNVCTKSVNNQVINSFLPVNLNELLHDILTIYTQRLLAEGIVVSWQPVLNLPSLLGDERRLRSLFKSLIDNSIASMSNHNKQRELRIFISNSVNLISVVFEDTGGGIPAELHFKVFEPFFSDCAGVGMGLAIAQEVANLHSGSIRIDPSYNQGSRFILQFPIVKASSFLV